MRHLQNALAIFCVLLVGVAEAQRPNQRGRNNARGPQGNRGGFNNAAQNNANNAAIRNRFNAANNGFNAAGFNGVNQAGQAGMQNGIGNRGGMDPAQMAQALVANFDNDGNGALDVNELMAALQGLRQMMQNGREQVLQARGGQQQAIGGANANQNGGRFGQRPGPPGQNAGGRGGNGNRGPRGRGR